MIRRVLALGTVRLVLLSTVFMVAAVVVRVTVAPLALPLNGLLEQALAEQIGAPARVDSVSVQIGAGRIRLFVRNLRAHTPRVSASIEEVAMSQGLFGGRRELVIDAPMLHLDPSSPARPDDAAPRRAVGLPNPAKAIPALDRLLGGAVRQAKAAGLWSVTIRDGRIDLISPGRPITEARVFQNVSATLDVSKDLHLTARMIGAEGPITFDLQKLPKADGAGHTLEIRAGGIVPKDLAPIKPVQDGFALSPYLSADFAPDGTMTRADIDLGIGSGTLIFGFDPPRVLDRAGIDLTLSADQSHLLIREAVVEAGSSQIEITGALTPGAEAGDPWGFRLAARDAVFDAPDIEAEPAVIDVFDVEGRIDLANKIIHFDKVRGASDMAGIDAVLAFDFSDGARLSGAANLSPSKISTLIGAWPPVVAYDPRKAVIDTILGGIVKGGTIELALTPLELDGDPSTSDMVEGAMSIDLAFADVSFTTPELPISVQRAHGLFRIRDKKLMARIDGGIVKAGEGGTLRLLEGTFTIREMGQNPSIADLTARVEGPVSAVVALAEKFDLPQLKETALKPDDVTGTITADLRMTTPLGKNVEDSDRQWAINARLTDAGASVPIGGQTFADANVEVSINPRRLAARGRASINGLKVDVNYSELFAGEKSGAARVVLTDEDRRKQGFDTGDALRGPIEITIEQNADATRTFSADLTEATIEVPGFTKPKGQALSAEGEITGEGKSMTIGNLRIDGRTVAIAGEAAIEDGGLKLIDLTRFGLSQGDQAQLKVTPKGKGYAVELDARTFDARKLLDGLSGGNKSGGEATKMPPIDAKIRGTRVRIGDDTLIADLKLDADHDGTRIARLALTGLLDDVNAGSFAVQIAPSTNGNRRLQGDITELGRLLSATDIYERMRGGRTTVDATMLPDGTITGRLVVRDFVLTEEQTLEEIIARSERAKNSAQSGRSPLPLSFQPTETQQEGMAFSRLSIDFEKKGDIVTIQDAILTGNVIGGTASGTVDLKAQQMTLNGTFIPAYGVNNLFGRVPLVGQILGGGDKGGLIGVTFRVAGPMKKPELWVNPISAIAPGIFRKIFEFR
ncbi:AsmA-like C-terminal region-containing protein [Acuticoccus sp. M5D2P5]|uniref:AsmA-like C-terminal domain-containing protein n=1 Tax=Acuticoccus kalidii TaxID=2910977 RepID=UPI001F21FEE8|nr:AsmA-like C-terminal region-containing protein [Acuticoccus kalidii]